jgi:subtilisin family serine protease
MALSYGRPGDWFRALPGDVRPPLETGAGWIRVLSFALLAAAISGLSLAEAHGQEPSPVEIDTLWQGSDAVGVVIPLDSLVAVSLAPMNPDTLLAIVQTAIPDAVPGREMVGLSQVFTFPELRRAELVSAARRVQSHPGIRWSGFMIGRPGRSGTALVTDEILVRFVPNITRDAVEARIRSWGAVEVREPGYPGDHHVLRVTDASRGDAITVSNLAHLDSLVEYAQPNFVFSHRAGSRGGAPHTSAQWHHTNIKTLGAWSTTKGDQDIVIAVIELNGFDTSHPDFLGRLWENPWEAAGPTPPDPEPAGWKPGDLNGWSFGGCMPPDNPLTSTCGSHSLSAGSTKHPTQVAGMAAGNENAAQGVAGVCPGCSLMFIGLATPIIADDPELTWSYDADVRGAAIRYAYLKGASVINLSWDAFLTDFPIRSAVQAAAAEGRNQLGTTIVNIPDVGLSSGGGDVDFCPPTGTKLAALDSLISVSRTDVNDVRQSISSGKCLDLLAPGIQVTTTDPVGAAGSSTGDYAVVDGNSFAAPIVAGVAGLMLSENPTLSWREVQEILFDTAEKVDNGGYGPDGHSTTHGFGRVSAFAAVKSARWYGLKVDIPTSEPPHWSFAWLIPMEWIFNYVSGDHHMNVHGVWIEDDEFDAGSGELDWTTRVVFADKNFDDDYWWEVAHGVFAFQGGFSAHGESPWIESGGGRDSDSRTFQDPALEGLDAATVVLKGWQFDFADPDHHVKTISIRLQDVEFDAATGSVHWVAEAEYRDKTTRRDYRWRYQWQVLGLDDGEIVHVSKSGSDGGNTALHRSSEARASLRGFEEGIALPQGWRFEYDSPDHQLNEHRFGVRNFGYDPGSGRVGWTVVLNYSDKNFDDAYSWAYDLAIVGFNGGLSKTWWGGPRRSDGGAEETSFSVRVRY